MNKDNLRGIDLDLSLTVSPQQICNQDLKNFAFNFDKWHKDLTSWIEFIGSDEGFFCPEAVRSFKKFSMGLQFTDDSTIFKLNSKWRHKQEITDVLSFPLIDSRGEERAFDF